MKKIVKRKVKNLKVGDKLVGSDNSTNEITHLWPVHQPKEMYQIEFEDGSVTKCGDTHLWYSETEEDLLYKDEFKNILKDIVIDDSVEKELMTIEPLAKSMATNENEIYFYKRALESLGWDSELNKTYKLYDKKSLTQYLKDMKDGNIDIRVGKVRTTKEIFDLCNKGIEVSIPKIGGINGR